MSTKAKDSPAPLLYFDLRTGGYWLPHGSRFLNLDTNQSKLHLRRGGLSKDTFDAQGLNEIERALVTAQLERYVDYSGPLAGHQCGRFETSAGLRVLVTSQACPPIAKAGKFHWIERYLETLFAESPTEGKTPAPKVTQLDVVLSWLKQSRESLLLGDFRPCPLLVIAGDSGCGKSLFQAFVTEFLGGRAAKPYRYMVGETAFNSDLAAAEHLQIEDENATTDIRSRRNFGGKIKEFVVNRELSVHGKGKTAITLPTFRRMTLSVNCEPENLMILPPLDVSLLDKISLLKCQQAKLSSDRIKNWSSLVRELPAFCHFLDRYTIPHKLRDSRYGCKAYQHQELLDALSDLAPETRLMNLIDEIIPAKDFPWTGSAEDLEQTLRNSRFCFAVDRLLGFPGACGTYLGRLRKSGRVLSAVNTGRTRWTIASV